MNPVNATNQFENIPEELQKLNQWVVWRLRDRGGKSTKVPYQTNGDLAKVNDPNSWAGFVAAKNEVETGKFDGIGFVFTESDQFVGLDFDNCVNEDGEIRHDVERIIRRLDSYTEYSPSGRGIHCIVMAEQLSAIRSARYEIYSEGRYFTVTGNRVLGTSGFVGTRINEVNEIRIDAKLINDISRSNQSTKFEQLFRGDVSSYESQSEADLALAAILSFWTGGDKSIMDRVFRLSNLHRPKWDEVHSSDGRTYGNTTLDLAVANGKFKTAREVVHQAATPGRPIVRPHRLPGDDFWEITGDKCRIKHAALVDFLQARGFGKYYPAASPSSVFIRVINNIVQEISTEQVKDFVFGEIRELDEGDRIREALVRGSNVYLSRALLECLPDLNPTFHRDNSDTAFFYFKNGVLAITTDHLELIPYQRLSGYIWKDAILDREFVQDLSPDDIFDTSEFGQFLQRVCGADQPERLKALTAAIGYLLHTYKDRAHTKAICFLDEAISDVPSGRSGKSLVASAIGQIIPSVRIDGRNFNFYSPFAFQDVRVGTTLVEFNDVPKNFPFARLFSVITDDMQIERKNRDRYSLPFAESPKFMLSTNFVIEGEGGSHRDRIHEIEFSGHYNEHHRPIDEFEHRFFFDWNDDEWQGFYNVMVNCVQAYLKNGLFEYSHQNLKWRKLRQMTSIEFAEYMTSEPSPIQIGLKHNKKSVHEAFLDDYEELRNEVHQRTFTSWMRTYAQLMDFKFSESKSGASRYFQFSNRK